MHELAIADSILNAVRVEMTRYPGARPLRITVRIGVLTAIDPAALEFSFEALTLGTDLANLHLQIDQCNRVHHCPQCSEEFAVVDFNLRCPRCGSANTRFVSGDQLELASLELEDESSAA
jgi:hydrogenase nickel incorporation protein HypA/HybF